MALGLALRLEDVYRWHAVPNRALAFGEQYYNTSLDGYYYLDIARSLHRGDYGTPNPLRAVPDLPSKDRETPLLSIIVAGLAAILPFPIHSIAAILIPFLGVLIAVPLFLLGRIYAGSLMGLVAALFAMTAPYSVYRSGAGWVDTDCLNGFFALLVVYLFARFGETIGRERYLYYFGAAATYLVFLSWWTMAPGAVTVITLVPLMLVLLTSYRPGKRELVLFLGANVAILAIVWLTGGIDVHETASQLTKQFQHLSKESTSAFPSVGSTISEVRTPQLREWSYFATGSLPVSLASVVGLGLLFVRRPRKSLLLAAPVLLSAMGLFLSIRFVIFSAPVAALGLGYLISLIWSWRVRWSILRLAVPLLTVLAVLPAVRINLSTTHWPKPRASLVSFLDEVRSATPDDAVIWAWWDFGYPLLYWAERATVADGAIHSGERSVYLGLPFATSDVRLAANFIHFFAARGEAGMNQLYELTGNDKAGAFRLLQDLLRQGPLGARRMLMKMPAPLGGDLRSIDDWLEFLYPISRRPVYLLLNDELVDKTYWWYWFGSWDLGRGDGYHPTNSIRVGNVRGTGSRLAGDEGFLLDLDTGVVEYQGGGVQLSQLTYFDGFSSFIRKFETNPQGPAATYLRVADRVIVYDSRLTNSLFGMLYFGSAPVEGHFRPILYQMQLGQLWEVEGDRLARPATGL